MVDIKKSSEKMTKSQKCYVEACDVLEDLVEKENNPSLKLYRVMGSVYNDYPTCVKEAIEIDVIKKILKKPFVKLQVYNKDLFDLAYKAAEIIENDHGIKVILEKYYK